KPVTGHALRVDEASDYKRSVGGKRGRNHGSAGEPPRDVPAGDEVVVHALAGAAAEIEAERKSNSQVGDNRRPVKNCEMHDAGKDTTRVCACSRKRMRKSAGIAEFDNRTIVAERVAGAEVGNGSEDFVQGTFARNSLQAKVFEKVT